MVFFKNRQTRKSAIHVLRQSRNLRNTREDLMRESDLDKLAAAEIELEKKIEDRDWPGVEKATNSLYDVVTKFSPTYKYPVARENIEVVFVAVAVAMAFRTYFIQPFKIPTGSMEPTLYGIHAVSVTEPGITDKWPLKVVKWIVTGEWYTEIRVRSSGQLSGIELNRDDHSVVYCYVGDVRYTIPRDATGLFNSRMGQYLNKGDLLCRMIVRAGDHVFVNKVSWNFRRPRRGEVIVFRTDNIGGLMENTHYIKRLVGLPHEAISIDPPYLVANGRRVTEPSPIARVENMVEPGYTNGYELADARPWAGADGVVRMGLLTARAQSIVLGPQEYLGFGDNTGNSQDGRYWGAIPQENLVGPACLIYWPFLPKNHETTKGWGTIK